MSEDNYLILATEWQLEDPHVLTLLELRHRLAKKIEYLFTHNYPKLQQALYRIDVDEEKFLAIMKTTPVEKRYETVAQLVIDREFKKLQSTTQDD